ncbi:UDP-galactopyranose mutase [Botrimarina colliarenosi]|uniref:UDP-galactopyranose mutase n=1 Tax=Botrimarina colliarenosi TaxID=2528001 RepID=A0A5C6A792_9BACT|nr:UDP-galactopyranose mutase [Botrimarina colliarenosi]TWT95306.1 UDP-galactopyranose mutase [Botrimarina colliarenosi]
MPADYVIVGAGLFGSVFARQAAEAGRSVLLVDRRPHIAGNCFSERVEGIDVHRYGPHIFHTDNQRVWDYVLRFTRMNAYRHRGVVRHGDRMFSFPINLLSLHQLWGVTTPAEAVKKLAEARVPIEKPANLEEWALSQVGHELYELFVHGYTTKQWGRDPRMLPASILRRIPIRLTWDDRYFNDRFQGIPEDGYTRLFENLLDHPSIEIETGVDFFAHRQELKAAGAKLVYSGKIDEFFGYRFGELEYRSLRFETEHVTGDHQGAAIVNAAEASVPYTRTVEHKHFAMQTCEASVITREFPQKYTRGGEAFYPVRDVKNSGLYDQYARLARETRPDVVFGGRLGSYCYYDMHQVIAEALTTADRELGLPQTIRRAA